MGPLALPGAKVAQEDIDGGAAAVFTAPADQIPYLRVRVRLMASKINAGRAGRSPARRPGVGRGGERRGGLDRGRGPEGRRGGDRRGGPQLGRGPDGDRGPGAGPGRMGRPDRGARRATRRLLPVYAEVEDVPKGARLRLLAASADEVEIVRRKMRKRIEQMSKRHEGKPAKD